VKFTTMKTRRRMCLRGGGSYGSCVECGCGSGCGARSGSSSSGGACYITFLRIHLICLAFGKWPAVYVKKRVDGAKKRALVETSGGGSTKAFAPSSPCYWVVLMCRCWR
jgi:hypothetical protein